MEERSKEEDEWRRDLEDLVLARWRFQSTDLNNLSSSWRCHRLDLFGLVTIKILFSWHLSFWSDSFYRLIA